MIKSIQTKDLKPKYTKTKSKKANETRKGGKVKAVKCSINVPLRGIKSGVIDIDVDKNGIPTDKYWRRRLHDSKRDNCISINIDETAVITTEDVENNKKDKKVKENDYGD